MQALQEIYRALFSWRIWWVIARDDVIGRYRRTALGPTWLIVAQAAWIGGIYILRDVWSHDNNSFYVLFLSASLASWGLISGIILDAPIIFVRSKGYIESYPLPLPIYAVRSIAGAFVAFFHMLVVYLVVAIFQMRLPGLPVLGLIPAWGLIALFGFGLGLALGPIGARFRDIGPAIASIINLLFILSPVFWLPTPAQLHSLVVVLNPLYYLIEIARAPLLGYWAPLHVWAIALAIAVATFSVGMAIFRGTRPLILFWL